MQYVHICLAQRHFDRSTHATHLLAEVINGLRAEYIWPIFNHNEYWTNGCGRPLCIFAKEFSFSISQLHCTCPYREGEGERRILDTMKIGRCVRENRYGRVTIYWRPEFCAMQAANEMQNTNVDNGLRNVRFYSEMNIIGRYMQSNIEYLVFIDR